MGRGRSHSLGRGVWEIQAERWPNRPKAGHTLTPRNLGPPSVAIDRLRQTFVLLTREIRSGPQRGLVETEGYEQGNGPANKLSD